MNAAHLTIAIAALALTACGGEASSDATASTSSVASSTAATSVADQPADGASTVTISRSRFDNVELRVAAGTTVTFVNTDSFDHTVTSKDDSPLEFDSGAFGEGETFEITLDEPGEYAYFCQIHPTMRGVVIVE